jgi:hypothetical protein
MVLCGALGMGSEAQKRMAGPGWGLGNLSVMLLDSSFSLLLLFAFVFVSIFVLSSAGSI